MLTQVELDEVYTECYNVIARSHKMSRREYIAEFLIESANKVPGLVDKIRKEMSNGIQQDGNINLGTPRNILLEMPEERTKRYRFTRRDTGEILEGEGTSAGPALTQATGKVWMHEEFIKEFLDPQVI